MNRLFLNERAILLAVILNSLVIFALYFPSQRDDPWLLGLDYFFILFFLMEVVVKLAVLKPRPYFSNPWNRFDFFIIVGSLPVLFLAFFDVPDTTILILLRLFRLVRLVRFLRFIPNVEQVMQGLGRALKSSVLVLAALFFLNLLLAMVTCHFYADTAPRYFGDPLVSFYSIFQMFTLEGWNEIPDAITPNSASPWRVGMTRLYFGSVVLLGGIFGIGLANAIFVDEMTMDNNRELERKVDALTEEIRALRRGLNA
ncbi:voltage-gated sodium channel [Neolewinella xylanilytica]|uniref:Voltage-gated sodium channel n=1 Tax=Neolewinella xylanilytica TaxID=1514080 RepID=A0A2S6I9T7_9BACT|nr:ion transporter [Neolewinella xylanilytica]PPK88267.1 voltage-gated sodium channel [Neolewinella xylanilytica]